ncbi:hypothetical protein [Myroides sp. DW712]|uniref:hypothetical protein n=1 Tax=Myroides sp. DW712 TaxID=3389800 RepID=UPI00397A131E
METRDTILQLIEQTALTLRAFFNSLPLEDQGELLFPDFVSKLKEQTELDVSHLLFLESPEELQVYLELHPSFDAKNQELLADLLAATATQPKRTNSELVIAYQRLALPLYQGINQTTQTYDAARQEKIKALQAML